MGDYQKLDPTTLKSYKKPHPIPPFLYVLAAIVAGIFVLSTFPPAANPLVGQPSPRFLLKDLKGDVKSFEPKSDKIKVLDFWASWCGPCFKQTPALLRLEAENPDVQLWSINTDAPGVGRRAKIARFQKRGGWHFPVILDSGRVTPLFNVTSFPTIIFVKKDGTLSYARAGVHSYAALVKQLNEARKP